MKKLIALSILVSVFAAGAFAEDSKSSITITGSAEAALTPLQIVHGGKENPDGSGGTYTDTYVGAGLGRPGDPQGPMVQLNAAADFEDVLGAKVDLQFFYNTSSGGGEFAIGDFAELWWKPTTWFKMDVGRFNEDKLRGKVGDDNWSNWTVGMKGKDEIFTRFKGTAGALLAFTPIEGLYIGVMVPRFAQFNSDADPFLTGAGSNVSTGAGHWDDKGTEDPTDDTWVDGTRGDPWRAAQIYKGIQAAVGYEIQGIGLVRIQYVGSRNTEDPNKILSLLDFGNYTPARLEAAFAYTGMEGLVLDLGLKFWFPTSSYVTDFYIVKNLKYTQEYAEAEFDGSLMLPFQVSLGANFTTGDIGIAARIDTGFAGGFTADDTTTDRSYNLPFYLNFHLWPSYNLGFATIGLDFGLLFQGTTTMERNSVSTDMDQGGINVGFGLWLKKSFGDSSVKAGLAYRVGTDFGGVDPNKTKHPGVLSVPIVFDYSF